MYCARSKKKLARFVLFYERSSHGKPEFMLIEIRSILQITVK